MTKRKIERTWFAFITKRIMVSRPIKSSLSSFGITTSSSIEHPYIFIYAIFIILLSCIGYVNSGNSGIKSRFYNEKMSSTTPMTPTPSTSSSLFLNDKMINQFTPTSLKLKNSDQSYKQNLNNNNYYNVGKNNSNYSSDINNDNTSNINDNSNKKNNNNKKTNSLWSVGNELWDNIIIDCYRMPTFSCFQKNVYSYLDKTLDINDVNVTNNLKFYRNKVDYTKYTKEANLPHNDQHDHHHHQQQQQQDQEKNFDNGQQQLKKKKQHQQQQQQREQPQQQKLVDDGLDNEIPNESRSDSSIEEVTNALYGKSVKFAMTHDIEIKLPEIFFNGVIVRISPRSIEGNGAVVKLELMPKQEIEEKYETGRIFKKKIQQFIKNKLLLSFLALIIIIKLIKVKLFWLLPIIVGVSTAKKLILKFLLFLFPALSHIFKLCSYYHDSYHATKYHHHHHHVKHHHHTVVPPWYNEHSAVILHGPELIFTDPPRSHPVEFLHQAQAPLSHYESPDWENSGPGLGSEYISDIHRNAHVDGPYFKPKLDDANEINSWGLGTTHPAAATSHNYNVHPFVQEPAGAMSAQRLKSHHGPVYSPQRSTPPITAAQIAAQYGPAINQNSMKDIQRAQAQAKEALRIQAEQRLVAQQQKILQQQPFVQDAEPILPKGYDPFYSPILAKIDKILLQIGFTDDACKERLVCSMYKNPNRYSPHSNFVSAELSRDTNELEKPSSTNAAVIKFYRYVQAARDGQEHRDCLRLYPHCTISTE